MELGKVGEDVLHVGACHREILDRLALQVLGQLAERLRESHVAVLHVDTHDSVAYLNGTLGGLNNRYWACIDGSHRLISCLRSAIVDQLGHREVYADLSSDVGFWVGELGLLLLQLNCVPLSVLSLQVVRGAKHHEPSIDHDSNLVAKLLSLVHTMGSEKNRRHVHLLDHAVEGSSGDWVHPTGRLIQEENLGAEHERLRTAQLSFVTST